MLHQGSLAAVGNAERVVRETRLILRERAKNLHSLEAARRPPSASGARLCILLPPVLPPLPCVKRLPGVSVNPNATRCLRRRAVSRNACVARSHALICHAAKCAQSCICHMLQDAFVLLQCDAQ
eukprot:3824377-Rhodomonas_salina.1